MIEFDRTSQLNAESFTLISIRAELDNTFNKMLGEAEIVFSWFSHMPWESTRNMVTFFDCLVQLSQARGLEYYEASN